MGLHKSRLNEVQIYLCPSGGHCVAERSCKEGFPPGKLSAKRTLRERRVPPVVASVRCPSVVDYFFVYLTQLQTAILNIQSLFLWLDHKSSGV